MSSTDSLRLAAENALRVAEAATKGPWRTLGDKDHSTVWAPTHNGFFAVAAMHKESEEA